MIPDGSLALPLKILVVDDHKEVANSLGWVLKSHGQEVRMAYDGRQALAVAAEFRPNVVVLDLDLPLMDGFSVARELRRLFAGVPLWLMAVARWDEQAAEAAGAELLMLVETG